MKRTLFSFMFVCLLFYLPTVLAASPNTAQQQQAKVTYVQVSIKIVPDQEKVVPAFEGGEPPTFTVETEPGWSVCITVATDFGRLVTKKDGSIETVFASYYGSKSAGIPPAVLKPDAEGHLTYTLPAPVFEAMSEGPSQIYYIAEAIDPVNDNHYISVGASFDYHSGKEEDAPRIAIEVSPRIAQAEEHFKTGEAHFLKEEYAAAAKEFNEALIFNPNPVFEYYIGICHFRLGLQYLSAAVSRGRFSADEEARIKDIIASVESSIEKQR